MRFSVALFAIFALLLSFGCFESEEEYVINPDGSGKVEVKALLQPVDIMSGSKPNPEREMKNAVKRLLEDSTGVDAWTDVSFKKAEGDRIEIRATAYFKDLSKLKLQFGSVSSDLRPSLLKRDDGSMVLELKGGKKREPEPAGMSEEEIEKKVKADKARYQQMKPMLSGFASTLKQAFTFQLPGELKECSNFAKSEDDSLRLSIEGARILAVVDKLMEDEEWLKNLAKSGKSLQDTPLDDSVNEKLFGEKGPVRALFAGEMKPLFDYASEVAAARKSYQKMLKELGLADQIAVAPADGGGFKSLKVGGVRLVKFSDPENDIRPFNYDEGYALALIGEFNGSVLKVTEGRVEKALADSGQNLLPDREWDRKISFPKLSKDRTRVMFEVKMAVPGEDVRYVKEVSGILEYTVSSGTKELDLGITKFKEGARGKELSAVIKSVGEDEWEEGKQQLVLEMGADMDSVKSFDFFDKDGNKFEVSRRGYFSSGSSSEITFSIMGKLPEEGRIVIVMHDNVKKFKIPFKLENITLTGEPAK